MSHKPKTRHELLYPKARLNNCDNWDERIANLNIAYFPD